MIASVGTWFFHWIGMMGVILVICEINHFTLQAFGIPILDRLADSFLVAVPSAIISGLPAAAVWHWIKEQA